MPRHRAEPVVVPLWCFYFGNISTTISESGEPEPCLLMSNYMEVLQMLGGRRILTERVSSETQSAQHHHRDNQEDRVEGAASRCSSHECFSSRLLFFFLQDDDAEENQLQHQSALGSSPPMDAARTTANAKLCNEALTNGSNDSDPD